MPSYVPAHVSRFAKDGSSVAGEHLRSGLTVEELVKGAQGIASKQDAWTTRTAEAAVFEEREADAIVKAFIHIEGKEHWYFVTVLNSDKLRLERQHRHKDRVEQLEGSIDLSRLKVKPEETFAREERRHLA